VWQLRIPAQIPIDAQIGSLLGEKEIKEMEAFYPNEYPLFYIYCMQYLLYKYPT
jgi:hypothetical protein